MVISMFRQPQRAASASSGIVLSHEQIKARRGFTPPVRRLLRGADRRRTHGPRRAIWRTIVAPACPILPPPFPRIAAWRKAARLALAAGLIQFAASRRY